jgi:hypothetical protein
VLRKYLAGKLPDHSPWELHHQIHRDYGRERVLSEFIGATVGRGERI